MTTLETPRFMLRRFEASDFDDVHKYAQDPEATLYQSWGPNSEDDTREFLRRSHDSFDSANGDDVEFAIVDRDCAKVVGGCGIHARRKQFREFEIGWTLNPAYWRRGVGTECGRRLVDFAFAIRNVHRLYALVDVENVASIALAEKLGFIREGRQGSDTLVRGKWRDTFVYAQLEP